ncbi:MAG: hypothetical protein HYX87_02315 [Chloroflexi bacterium]|nr:hypothetical protein [Chloroflexota bacterium]
MEVIFMGLGVSGVAGAYGFFTTAMSDGATHTTLFKWLALLSLILGAVFSGVAAIVVRRREDKASLEAAQREEQARLREERDKKRFEQEEERHKLEIEQLKRTIRHLRLTDETNYMSDKEKPDATS